MGAPRRVVVFLVIGLIAASQSGNIIRLGEAHPVAIAAWRLFFASVFLAPLARGQFRSLKTLLKREWLLLGLAGFTLAIHFFAWIGAVQLTTVANASMFFAINPVLTATAGHLIFGERISPKLIISIATGISGLAIIGWGDLTFRTENLLGDGLALLCSALFTVYFLLGKRLRQRLNTNVYVVVLYGSAALVSFATMLAMDLPLAQYDDKTWLCFLLMALVPTMIGHTSFASAVKYIDAGRISAATLSEPILAGIVAYFAWDETITSQGIIGYGLVCTSVLVLALDRDKAKAKA